MNIQADLPAEEKYIVYSEDYLRTSLASVQATHRPNTQVVVHLFKNLDDVVLPAVMMIGLDNVELYRDDHDHDVDIIGTENDVGLDLTYLGAVTQYALPPGNQYSFVEMKNYFTDQYEMGNLKQEFSDNNGIWFNPHTQKIIEPVTTDFVY